MAIQHTYATPLPHCTGVGELKLEAGTSDGKIFVALNMIGDASTDRRCLLDVEDAELLIIALEAAITNVNPAT